MGSQRGSSSTTQGQKDRAIKAFSKKNKSSVIDTKTNSKTSQQENKKNK